MSLSRSAVQFILTSEVENARQRFTRATQAFREVMSDVPSGLPYPDGVVRIERASREWQSASEAYSKALARFHQFILDEIIPEEFRDPRTE
jgi:hypothetical protein